MINFIICDDNKIIEKKVESVIDKVMMQNKLAYKKYGFYDYDDDFFDMLNNDLTSRIYILDIETPSASGIDVARQIRENDVDSIIIFLTGHQELGSVLLKDEIMFLTFICKFDNMEKRLESAINSALKMVGVRQNIRFDDKGILYTITLTDILYVTTSTFDRKTVIVTSNNEYKTNRTFSDICSMLSGDFEQSHRSCVVNKKLVVKVNKKSNEIEFSNGKKIDLLSDTYKKEFK